MAPSPCLDCIWNLNDPTECQRSRLDCENHHVFILATPSIPNTDRGRDFVKLVNDFKREEATKRAAFAPGPYSAPGQSRHIEVPPPQILRSAFEFLQEENAEVAARLARQDEGVQRQGRPSQSGQVDERGLYVPLSNPLWQAMAPPGWGQGPMAQSLPPQAVGPLGSEAPRRLAVDESKGARRRRLNAEYMKTYRIKRKEARRRGTREQLGEDDVEEEQDTTIDVDNTSQQTTYAPMTCTAPQLRRGGLAYPNPSQGTYGAPVLGQGLYQEPRQDDSTGGAFSRDDQPTQPYPGVAQGRSGTGGNQGSQSGYPPSAAPDAPSYAGPGYQWPGGYHSRARDRERSSGRDSNRSTNDRQSRPNSRTGAQTGRGDCTRSSSGSQSRSTSAEPPISDMEGMSISGRDKGKDKSEHKGKKSFSDSYSSKK